jgi:hypothetical protein
MVKIALLLILDKHGNMETVIVLSILDANGDTARSKGAPTN